MQHMRDAAHHMEEEWGFLIIDACNAFNDQHRMVMLWILRHEWPASGARFTFNCYRHWCTLVIRGKDGNGAILIFSKEGVVQGDPLSMFAYGIGILTLIHQLKKEFPLLVEQPWYADDDGAGGKFDRIRSHVSIQCRYFLLGHFMHVYYSIRQ
jgi:hypothetical protein